ncbi:MAG: TonB-dependent siderophore receptor [Proteobacteria bacterium]|nr:TonB-dependent siderophore receptor [Pseudomonadota bacterium]
MMTKMYTKLIENISPLLFISILFVASFAITADDSENVEEIVVKGNVLYADQVNALKTPVPILDVPQTVSIVTDDDIRKQGFRGIGDIIRYIPGVNTSQGEGHRDSVVFRGVRSTVLNDMFGAVDFGVDSFGANDLTLDYNVLSGDNSALRFMMHSDTLENHRDHYDGKRTGINPALKLKVTERTTLDLSYEYADHERFIDRGIPTENGEPVKRFEKITFGDKDVNLTTLEATIFRATLSTEFSDTSKGNLSIISSEFEKMYKNYYASGYNAGDTVVTMDGYLDPTERENTVIAGNLVNEIQIGTSTHTLLFGGEIIDTSNDNHRYDTFWSTTSDDNEIFNITRPMNFLENSSGFGTSNDFTAKLSSKTKSNIEVSSIYFQDQIDFSDRLKLMIGGRHDTFDITVADIKSGTSQSREDKEFSPRAGIIFKPSENVSWYYSYSESFLPRSGEQYKKLTALDAALDPDLYQSREFGVKIAISKNLSFAAAYFDSEQTIATRDTSGEGAEIIGLQVDGLEIELKGKVNDKMNIVIGFSSMDGKTSSGGEPREIPEHTLSLFATYKVSEKFEWAFGITQQGESNISNNKPELILPEYTRVDFGAYYKIAEGLSIQMNLENLTDELYFPHSHSTHQTSVGEPFNARISIRKTF